MNSFHRVSEINILDEVCSTQNGKSKFLMVEGSRHCGKTTFISEFLKQNKGIYFKVQNTDSRIQLTEFSRFLKSLNIKNQFIPSFSSWEEFFSYMIFLSRSEPLLLVIDDFHKIELLKRGFYSRLVSIWKNESVNANLTLIAVSTSLSGGTEEKLSSQNPIREVVDSVIHLRPLTYEEVVAIALGCTHRVNSELLRDVYIIFGGMPAIYDFLEAESLWEDRIEDVMIRLVELEFAPLKPIIDSLYLTVPEKGRVVYTSILQAIAEGVTNVSKIGARIGIPATSVIKYLTMLEKQKGLIKREIPVGTPNPEKSRFGRYVFRDRFHAYWYRFIEPYCNDNRMPGFAELRQPLSEQLDEYIKCQYGSFVCGLLNSGANPEMLELFSDRSNLEAGALWDKKTLFETALYNRDTKEVAVLHFVWEAGIDFLEMMRDLWQIQNHFGIRKAEMHIFFRNEEIKNRERKITISAVKPHIGFPDELLFSKLAGEPELGLKRTMERM